MELGNMVYGLQDSRGINFEGGTYKVGSAGFLYLGQNSSFSLKHIKIEFQARRTGTPTNETYSVNLLFGVSFGDKLPRFEMADEVDLLVAKQISWSRALHGDPK